MADAGRIAIINARVWTGNPRRPWADAVLISGDRIELVGSSAEVRKRALPTTRRIDGAGMLVAPLWKEPRAELDADALIQALREAARHGNASLLNVLEARAPADLVMFDLDVTRAIPNDSGIARVVLLIVSGRVLVDQTSLA